MSRTPETTRETSSGIQLDGRARYGMQRMLPSSLSSMRSFEAVARLRSFTKAACELNITQTAVSHQIRKLEAFLGVQLFVRDRDGVRLSEPGREYVNAVTDALNILSFATQQARDYGNEESLSIVAVAAFGLKCLMPILPAFRSAYPDISVRFETIVSYAGAAGYGHDISIRYGSGRWQGVVAHRICPEEGFPVCSPDYLADKVLRTPEDLFDHTIIITSSLSFRDNWPEWLARFGHTPDDFREVIVCDTMSSALQAAIDGVGIAMSRTPLVDKDLKAGRLVEPFSERIQSDLAYYLTYSPDRGERKAVRLFTDWLLAQFGDR
ncbi:LysR substrate-binding domain-containing protein [Paracandidimonas soli]|uniref:LysR substrate-binding domain-containing protein n=1 Tax=Paracandidimonas soli TaxID=1917182 RepID=UPI000A7CE5F2